MHHKDDDPKAKPAEEDPAMQLEDPNHVLDKVRARGLGRGETDKPQPYEMTEWDKTFTADMDQGACTCVGGQGLVRHVDSLRRDDL